MFRQNVTNWNTNHKTVFCQTLTEHYYRTVLGSFKWSFNFNNVIKMVLTGEFVTFKWEKWDVLVLCGVIKIEHSSIYSILMSLHCSICIHIDHINTATATS